MSHPKNLTRIVIVGNGFGGTYTLGNLHKELHGKKNIHITLVGEQNYFLFTPLLHEVATGSINPEDIIEPIRKLFPCCLNDFYLGRVEEIHTANQLVKINTEYHNKTETTLLPYDYLVLAQGSQTNYFNIPGAEKFTYSLKSIHDALRIKHHVVTQMERASHAQDENRRKELLSFVVVGGGPSGVEVAAELNDLIKETFSHYYSRELVKDAQVILIQRAPELLPQFGQRIRTKSAKVLRKKGINVLLNSVVKEVAETHVVLEDGTLINTETVIWVAGIMPQKINFDSMVATTPDGRIVINDFLQLVGADKSPELGKIFVLGDAAALELKDKTFLPALAQVAEKQALMVASNIKRALLGKKLRSFAYHSSGNLVSLGQWMAAGQITGITFSGHITWWLWRTVYLSKMISFRKKMRVAIDWTINLFSPRDISQI